MEKNDIIIFNKKDILLIENMIVFFFYLYWLYFYHHPPLFFNLTFLPIKSIDPISFMPSDIVSVLNDVLIIDNLVGE